MDREENELLFLFFDLMHKIRDILIINRPDLLKMIKADLSIITKDPFGKYFQTILYIGQNQHSTMKEFANYFNLKKGTATGLIDRLVDKGLVQRQDNPDDRRIVELVLTQKGNALFQKSLELQKDEIDSVIKTLSDTDKVNLRNLLKKINNALVIKAPKDTDA